MRRFRVLMFAAMVAVTIGGAPARAATDGPHAITFHTTAPCGIACPYWDVGDALDVDVCAPTPLTVPGSWADVRLTAPDRPAEGLPVILEFEIRPVVDYDAYICRLVDAGTPNEHWETTRPGGILGAPCDDPVGAEQVPIGCSERVSVPARPGDTYVLRVYNFSDAFDCPGSYSWIFI